MIARSSSIRQRTADAATAAGMQTLLQQRWQRCARLPRSASSVHWRGRNSCKGAWTQTAFLSVSFNPLKLRLPQRATLSFQVNNPLGAADLLLHGSKNLRGWGQPAHARPDTAVCARFRRSDAAISLRGESTLRRHPSGVHGVPRAGDRDGVAAIRYRRVARTAGAHAAARSRSPFTGAEAAERHH